MKGTKIGITGTRSGGTVAQLESLVAVLIAHDPEQGIEELHHGDCVGVDLQAATMARDMEIHTVCHPPVDESLRAHHKSDTILPQQNHFARNRSIVDACDKLIVIPFQDEWSARGGTWYTHDYALKKGTSITIIWPNGEMIDTDTVGQTATTTRHREAERTAGETEQAAGENKSGDISL